MLENNLGRLKISENILNEEKAKMSKKDAKSNMMNFKAT